jgi:threonine aldolase
VADSIAGVSSGLVDLRSDTVTRPTPEMRRAMAEAEVGDDGFGEDPTVNRLEEAFSERVGKEAALFVPSGVMANQIALRVLAAPGTAVVAGRRQHVVAYELGAGARNAAIQFIPVDDTKGTVSPADVAWAREAARHHQPEVSLVCVENTHMAAGGTPWDVVDLQSVQAAASGLPVHMDGARLFNAEMATGVAAATMASAVLTVSSCLSKGLCAPVGSLLAGPAAVIADGRIERKRLGGAMRQAGVLAAAGLVALESMVARLAEDHLRARRLAEAVADRWPDVGLDPDRVRTNIVVFTCTEAEKVLEHLRAEGVLAEAIGPGVLRFVTHRDVDDDGIERAQRAVASAP